MAWRLKPIEEQTIVVTGASSGIGLATAHLAAARGANVVLVARNQDALREAAKEINGKDGGRAIFIAADMADEGAPHRIASVADQAFGGFDTWVNNAAVAILGRLDSTTMSEHRQIFDIGYFGLAGASLFAAAYLKRRGGGAIVNIGSILSDRAAPLQGAYSAMKHAVQGFTESLRMELEMEKAPVSVTLIKPAGIHTPYPEHARDKLAKHAAIPPTAYDPRLVAEAICFAAANRKRTMTVGGQGLVLTKLAGLFPRTTDRIMEAFFEKAQSTSQPPPPGVKDNLFQARRDGRIESSQDQYVRRHSITLKAQMHPVATAAVLAGIAIAAAGFLSGRKAAARRRDFSSERLRHQKGTQPAPVRFGETGGGHHIPTAEDIRI
ncbi:SDR family NAD(P)-dependent oxidoreductase [Allosphingosinicella flava]|uniref:SDR family NAD(P)-dependent oxidoreductase n=1 Tax=Allosphingosinicella flava TaxID=2771430 RepID=A0A7T2GLM4_9SPHN|nr:SDR family oxidoreductase [Sphingosinicella flava]QPQ55788.1 SDR family NAD(P)-dependent oxidoreductase [Sphingosinicella flava]